MHSFLHCFLKICEPWLPENCFGKIRLGAWETALRKSKGFFLLLEEIYLYLPLQPPPPPPPKFFYPQRHGQLTVSCVLDLSTKSTLVQVTKREWLVLQSSATNTNQDPKALWFLNQSPSRGLQHLFSVAQIFLLFFQPTASQDSQFYHRISIHFCRHKPHLQPGRLA